MRPTYRQKPRGVDTPPPRTENNDLFVPKVKGVEKWLDEHYLGLLETQARRDRA